jgi:hypothetical protein
MTHEMIIYTDSHIEENDIPSGTHIRVTSGDFTAEGEIGEDVTLEVVGNVILKKDAGRNLAVSAGGDFTAENVGDDADIYCKGKASALTLGYCGQMTGRGVGVRSAEAKCGSFIPQIGNGVISLYRKPKEQESIDPQSCQNLQPLKPPTLN